MDVKEIQALHAQYASPTLTIEQGRQIASMPALSVPDIGGTRRGIRFGPILRYRRHALIALAVAALAGGGGMSAARIWQVLRTQAGPHTESIQPVATHASVPPPVETQADSDGNMPLNVAPPRPLSSSDFDSPAPPRANGLANVDSRSLAKSVDVSPAVTGTQPTAAHSVIDKATAAASPIHAPSRRAQPAAQPVAAARSDAPPVAEPATPARTQSTQPAPPVAPPEKAGTAVAPAVAAVSGERSPARIPRPTHHIASRHKPTDETPSEPVAASGNATKAPTAPTRTSDVQLF
ncbi:hypothetical protein SAMN05444172_9265 [Burkholderia sp. GAS332]|nr:hypothetical protein SAMN05444172_9265 [Burkholderia sp. GAS332]